MGNIFLWQDCAQCARAARGKRFQILEGVNSAEKRADTWCPPSDGEPPRYSFIKRLTAESYQ